MNKFSYIKSLWSPFVPFKIKFYAGKTKIGTPYFFPRKWVKDPNNPGYQKAIDKKLGFDFVSLGWKTKWKETDYRFEWSPLISFVFFGYQIAMMIEVEEPEHYWEAWLYYENNTSSKLTKRERINQCRKEFPLLYTVYKSGDTYQVDYYNKILRSKYK